MAKRSPKLSRAPQNINDELWYYEERKGVCVVVKALHIVYLPWPMICKSVDRYRAVQRAKKAAKVKHAK